MAGERAAGLATTPRVRAEGDMDHVQTGLLERQTFDLEHVEAADIIPVLQALTDTGGAAASAGAPRRGRGQPAPVVRVRSPLRTPTELLP